MPVGAVVGAGVLGAGATVYGANRAASAQTGAVQSSNALQGQMFAQTQANAAPFIAGGAGSFNTLLGRTPELTQPSVLPQMTTPLEPFKAFDPSMLESTPGYKFILDQAMKGSNNSFAAKGLGSSGAALKGGQDRAFNLASTTYQQQLDNYMKQNQQYYDNYWKQGSALFGQGAANFEMDMKNKSSIYNMLMGETQVGASAATGTGQISAKVGETMGNSLIGGGNATGAAYMAGANAITGAGTNFANTYAQNDLINKLLASKTAGTPAVATTNG